MKIFRLAAAFALLAAVFVFALPAGLHARQAVQKASYVVSFSSFLDETSALADLVLPDHTPLESWVDDIAESGSTETVVTLAPPAVLPPSRWSLRTAARRARGADSGIRPPS